MVTYKDFELTQEQVNNLKKANARKEIKRYIDQHGEEPADITPYLTYNQKQYNKYKSILYANYMVNDVEIDPEQTEPYVELVWDLAPDYRFFMVGEPWRTEFYYTGQKVQVAPKAFLVIPEKGERLPADYFTHNIEVYGFDSMTPGIKHVTIKLLNFTDGTKWYSAETTIDIEVRDYDHERYGFTNVSEDMEISFPSGYTLHADALSPREVVTYNWMDSKEHTDEMGVNDHAQMCSDSTYVPYNLYRGSSALTDTLSLLSAGKVFGQSTDGEAHYKLMAIYEDLTRVYTREIHIDISDYPVYTEKYDDYFFIGEYIVKKGETFDLADHNMGTGSISFDSNGYEFTFDNVNFTCTDGVSADIMEGNPGFSYMYSTGEEKHFVVNLIGNNYLIDSYYHQNASGFAFDFQHIGLEEDNGDLTFTGPGSLTVIGGYPGIYVATTLIIDAELHFDSYLDRRSACIEAYAIHVTDNGKVSGTSNGNGIYAMAGRILFDENSVINLNIIADTTGTGGFGLNAENNDEPKKYPAPRTIENAFGTKTKISGSESLQVVKPADKLGANSVPTSAIQAVGNVIVESKNFYVAITVPDERFISGDACSALIGVTSKYGNVIFNNAEATIRINADSAANVGSAYGTALAIACEENMQMGDTGKVYINNSNVSIKLGATIFNEGYAIYGVNDLTIEHSNVNIDERSVMTMSALYCSNGEVTVNDGSVVNVNGCRSLSSENTFGIFGTKLTVDNSKVKMNFNSGTALAILLGEEDHPASFDEDYTPVALVGFENVENISPFSIMESPGLFYFFETIYGHYDWGTFPASSFEIDNRS